MFPPKSDTKPKPRIQKKGKTSKYTDEDHFVYHPQKLIIPAPKGSSATSMPMTATYLLLYVGLMMLPAIDCPPWMLDPDKDTGAATEYIGESPGVVPMVVLTYFDVGMGWFRRGR